MQRVLAGIYHSRGAIVWEGLSWCWARLHRLGNGNRAGSIIHRGLWVAAPPSDALNDLGYDGAAGVALVNCSGLHSKTVLHLGVSFFRDLIKSQLVSFIFWGFGRARDAHSL